jgi:Enoyl-CoA hydratase/isomerase/Acyl-CoA dehydrogenase, N-terminal domain
MATATAVAAPVAATAAVKKAPKQLPAPNSDFYQLMDVLTAEEKAIVKKVRTYMETKVAPVINKYWSDDAFPFELLPSFKELDLDQREGGLCIGLVNEIVPPADLIARAEAILKKIAANAPIAVKFALEAANRGMETSQGEGLLLEASYFGLCAATEDKKEGTSAFLEKRAPQFHGR